ncbi:MAG: hypothetical protein JSS70_08850 [Bacteroidetes bacterium]|nr:hypothetical protein [Bacteroidota bacterium]
MNFLDHIWHRLETAMAPFHKINLVITCCLCGLQATFANFFEPLERVGYSLLLTFPLTAGLIIVLLILYNTDWKKITFIHFLLTPLPAAFLFSSLLGLSKEYGLEAKGMKFWDEINKKEQQVEKRHPEKTMVLKADTAYSPASPVVAGYSSWKQVKIDPDLKAPAPEAEQPWYLKIVYIRSFLTGIAWLKESFLFMFARYGPVRFISGVLLAFILSRYLQRGFRKKPKAGKL